MTNNESAPNPADVLSDMGVRADGLVPTSLYFIVSYVDAECEVPVVESLVFLGSNLEGGRDAGLYFQDAESYSLRGAYPQAIGNDVRVIVVGPDLPPNVFELDGVI